MHHLYVVEDDERDGLRRDLAALGVETAIHYPWTIGEQPAFAQARRAGPLATSEQAARRVLSLPCYGGLRSEEAELVAAALERSLARRGAER